MLFYLIAARTVFPFMRTQDEDVSKQVDSTSEYYKNMSLVSILIAMKVSICNSIVYSYSYES